MVTVAQWVRSKIMAAVGRRDTGPEKTNRSAIHVVGLRYRLRDTALPGTPDVVLKRYKVVIFTHGCE